MKLTMKFSITNACLFALMSGTASGQGEQAFWQTFMIQGLDSMATPTSAPIATTSDPTSAPTPTSAPSGSTSVPPSFPTCETIGSVICSVPEFSTLCGLIQITGLGSSLNEDKYTIFAPINTAFEAIPPELLLNPLAADPDILRNAILYHVVPEVEILAENLVCDGNLMMANLAETTTICLDDETFQVGAGNSHEALPKPKIIAQDGIACNGIIHAIDQVMLPSIDVPPTPVTEFPSPAPSASNIITTEAPTGACQSIAEVVCTLPQFEILCALVEDADLAGVLGGEDKFTVFAPTDGAFDSLSLEIADAIIADPDLLNDVLLTHVVAGEILSIDLECGGETSMVSGEETTTVCIDDTFFQAGAGNGADSLLPEIVLTDGLACNGVIHVVDQVILPGLD